MRLAILDRGQNFRAKALFAIIRLATGHPAPDVVKLMSYRSDFFGTPMSQFFQEAMRGASKWSLGDREAMAAVVSQANACDFCAKSHTATATLAYGDAQKVAAILADLETAPIGEPLRATLRMLRKLTLEHSVEAEDMRAVLAAGVSPEEIEDALAIAFGLNTINRLADAFSFVVPSPGGVEAGARAVLSRGYRL